MLRDAAVDFDGHIRIRADSTAKVDKLGCLLISPGVYSAAFMCRAACVEPDTDHRRIYSALLSDPVSPNSLQVTTTVAIIHLSKAV